MSNIKIICDSINDIPKDIVDKYDIELILEQEIVKY